MCHVTSRNCVPVYIPLLSVGCNTCKIYDNTVSSQHTQMCAYKCPERSYKTTTQEEPNGEFKNICEPCHPQCAECDYKVSFQLFLIIYPKNIMKEGNNHLHNHPFRITSLTNTSFTKAFSEPPLHASPSQSSLQPPPSHAPCSFASPFKPYPSHALPLHMDPASHPP